jgi:2-haloalkanoic acid dehalogenase type II
VATEWVTFDCYGTLIDWRDGITAAFRHHVPASAGTAPEALLEVYAEQEARAESGPWHPYREILRRTAEAVCAHFGWSTPEGDGHGAGFLADSLATWVPFPEVNAALGKLAEAGLKLAVLSNVDDDLMRASLDHMPVAFNRVVTAQRIHSYKPAPAHFEQALGWVGGEAARIVHVAQSHYHDVVPAMALGIPTVWVNRLAQLPAVPPAPTTEVRDLTEAADWVLAHRG